MILLLLAQLAGVPPAHASAPASANQPAVYQVSGNVTSARGGTPIAHCRVTLTPEASGENGNPSRRTRGPRAPGFSPGPLPDGMPFEGGPFRPAGAGGGQISTTTDGHGHFELIVPHAGSWILTGSARGFHASRYQQHGQFSTALVLSPQTPGVTASLALKPAASVTGYVRDPSGDPIDNGQVALQRAVEPERPGDSPEWTPAGFTQTDDRGHYEFSGLQDGSYRVAVQAHPWYASSAVPLAGSSGTAVSSPDPSLDVVYPVTWFPGSGDQDRAEVLHVQAGDSREADVSMSAVPALHLLIPVSTPAPENGNGQPARAMPPEVTRKGEGGSPFGGLAGYPMRVDSAGNWNIGGLSPGTYQVRTTRGDPSVQPVQITLTAGAPAVTLDRATSLVRLTITVPGAEDAGLEDVTLTDTSTHLAFSDRQRFRRRLGPSDDPSSAAARTLDVPPGDYLVSTTTAPGFSLKSLAATGATLAGRVLHIDEGTPSLSITLDHAEAAIHGSVQDHGAAVRGAMVLLVPAEYGSAGSQAEIRRAQTATDGSFTFAAVPAGPCLLVAVSDGWNTDWRDPAKLAAYLAQGVALNVPASGFLTETLEPLQP